MDMQKHQCHTRIFISRNIHAMENKVEKENKIMGITCKATGKMKGILKRVDNQIEANMKALKEKKSKKNNGNKVSK